MAWFQEDNRETGGNQGSAAAVAGSNCKNLDLSSSESLQSWSLRQPLLSRATDCDGGALNGGGRPRQQFEYVEQINSGNDMTYSESIELINIEKPGCLRIKWTGSSLSNGAYAFGNSDAEATANWSLPKCTKSAVRDLT